MLTATPTWRCVSGVSTRPATSKKSYEDLFSIEDTSTCNDEFEEVTDSSDDENAHDDDDEDEDAHLQRNLFTDLNEKYKSIRRSQAKSGSTKHIVFQMKSLKATTQSNHDMNRKAYSYADRNVRYGDPLPRRPLYRELRILSKYKMPTF